MFQTGGFPDLDSSFLFCPFWDFADFSRFFSRFARGWSGDFPDSSRFSIFLGLLRAPPRNSPERVRDTIWTFPEKSGKHPGLETPRFSFIHKAPTYPLQIRMGLDFALTSQTRGHNMACFRKSVIEVVTGQGYPLEKGAGEFLSRLVPS